ncbi:MAG: SDR family oxidoreductase [Verrucomicrobia bacterium]|nr:SDR family oxidoreductase [Verrucomicrobiota bacterium]
MNAFPQLEAQLRAAPKTWLVTGVAGFIGSNLLEALLRLDQRVVGLDNFATGKKQNIEQVHRAVTPEQWARFTFHTGDLRHAQVCQQVCHGADFVLHQGALGSVPRSLEDPLATHESNVTGFVNILLAARDQKARRFVYASSSSVYGDHPALPKREPEIGQPLSPYALSKYIDELYAAVGARCYGLQTVGLRYFNVFGRRQDPEGAYAAVIPKWIAAMVRGEPVAINGDGETSRDFCYIQNVVQVNLLAATADRPEAVNQVYNIALGSRITLNQLFALLRAKLAARNPSLAIPDPVYRDFRPGDVRHSQADISLAQRLLRYAPTHTVEQGLDEALAWYLANL